MHAPASSDPAPAYSAPAAAPAPAAAAAAVRDPERLHALMQAGLLVGTPAPEFDRLTELAAAVLRVPVALVSIVDADRQVFVGCLGLPEPWSSRRETPLSHSLCQHVVATGTPLVIEDARADPRLRDHAAIRDLGVIAYAGMPLTTSAGAVLGSFCAIDTRPRAWTGEELDLLRRLADAANTEIRLLTAQRAAAETAARLEAAVDGADLGAWSFDVATQVRWHSARASAMLGLDARESAVGIDAWLARIHPDDRARVRELHERTLAAADRYAAEYRVAAPDGSVRRVCGTGRVLRDDRGGAERVVGILQDVTERDALEAALRASERRFRTLQEISPDGSMLITAVRDPQGAIVDFVIAYANAAAARLLTEGDARIEGLSMREHFPESVAAGRVDRWRRVVETGESWQGDFAYTRGAVVHELRAIALKVDDGVHFVFTDVTALKAAVAERERLLAESERARREADAARADADAANRAKSDFLAMMSHELRTPLNAIGGYAELIEMGVRGPVTAEQRIDLARLQKSQRHLLGLINGVLDYAKIDAGAVAYAVEDVPLDEALATCEALIAPQVRSKKLTLDQAPSDTSLVARADREKVQQILLNLLSNAVKFTDAGGRIAVSCLGPVDGVVRVSVADTGRGIPAEQLGRVFEPFVQVDARLTRTGEGTGLGLAISRDLARGMGGDLTAESVSGVGSTFMLTLPAAR